MSSIKDGDAHGPGASSCDAPSGTGAEALPVKRRRPPTPHNCRNFIRRQTADAMPEIVDKFVGRAKEGSVPHFTSLAKVGGFDQRTGAAETPKSKRRSLARQLLDEVERYEAREAAELAAANAAALQCALQNGDQNEDHTGNRSPQESS